MRRVKKAFKIFSNFPSSCEFERRSWRGVLDTTLWDKCCQWFSPVSSTNKTDSLDITEILLKVALNIIKPKRNHQMAR
jgi:hypothetical protein